MWSGTEVPGGDSRLTSGSAESVGNSICWGQNAPRDLEPNNIFIVQSVLNVKLISKLRAFL